MSNPTTEGISRNAQFGRLFADGAYSAEPSWWVPHEDYERLRKHWEDACKQPSPAPARRVYLVPTGIVHEGEETYTRHEGQPPPLCDSECLYTSPPEPAVVHPDPEWRAEANIHPERALYAANAVSSFAVWRDTAEGSAYWADVDRRLCAYAEMKQSETKTEMPAWLPLSLAPMDGTSVRLKAGPHEHVGSYGVHIWGDAPEWKMHSKDVGWCRENPPTHWQPLNGRADGG
jgi:hypothetical protein